MTRAQRVRRNRLRERKLIKKEQRKEELRIKREAKELYDWVLDLFEKPAEYNSADEVHLVKFTNEIIIGSGAASKATGKEVEDEVMKKMAEIFKKEKGYETEYYGRSFPDSCISITIRIQ